MKEIVLNVLFCALSVYASFPDGQNHQPLPLTHKLQTESLLTPKHTLRALERIVLYFTKHMHNATVDFAFGLRVIEGELNRALSMFDKGIHTAFSNDKNLRQRVKNLYKLTKDAVAQSLQHIKANNRIYFDKTSFLVEDEWSPHQLTPQFTERNDLRIFPELLDGGLTEEESDNCMNSIAGKGQYETCTLGDCWKVMSAPGQGLYTTTHQLLWILLGTKFGCHEKLHQASLDDGYNEGVSGVIKLKCASVVVEMEALAIDGITEAEQDIFLEQGFVCGGIGFLDAVRPEWLQAALQWQDHTSGCLENDDISDSDFIEELQYWIKVSKHKWKSRKLQMDTVLGDGCSTHKTAVAAAFFATYLRLFFDPTYKKQMLDPFLENIYVPHTLNTSPIIIFQFFLFISAIYVTFLFRKKIMLIFNFAFRKLEHSSEKQKISSVI